MPRRSAIRAWALRGAALAVLAAAACSGSVEPLVRIGTNVWAGYEPLYLARDMGFLGPEKVKLVEYLSARDVSRAFANGSIEAAALTLDEVLLLADRGVSMKVALVMDISDGADTIIGRADLPNFEALRGKRVGAEIGAVGAYMLKRALEKHGMSARDITVVALPADRHVEAFRSGEVDAVVTFEPARSELLAAGGHELFTSREIPDEIVDVLVVHAGYEKKHGDLLKEIAAAWFKALAYIKQQPEDSAKRMVRRLRMSPDQVTAMYEGLKLGGPEENRRFLDDESPQLPRSATALRDAMTDMGLLRHAPDVSGLATDAALGGAGG